MKRLNPINGRHPAPGVDEITLTSIPTFVPYLTEGRQHDEDVGVAKVHADEGEEEDEEDRVHHQRQVEEGHTRLLRLSLVYSLG